MPIIFMWKNIVFAINLWQKKNSPQSFCPKTKKLDKSFVDFCFLSWAVYLIQEWNLALIATCCLGLGALVSGIMSAVKEQVL